MLEFMTHMSDSMAHHPRRFEKLANFDARNGEAHD
jgi:hypothetical protein